MSQDSISDIANWLYFENDQYGTFKACKNKVKEFLKVKEEYGGTWDGDFAEEMYKLNCYALEQMGHEKHDFPKFSYNPEKTISIIQMLKSVQCLIYQCSEENTTEKPLYKLLSEIEIILLQSIVYNLEEYKKALWD